MEEINNKFAEYHRQWAEENKEHLAEYNKRWREDNKERIKQYRQNNKEKITEQKKQWYLDNKEKILIKQKQWYLDNKEKILKYRQNNKEKVKQLYQKNKEKILERQKQYRRTPKGRALSLIAAYRRKDKNANRGECTLTAQWVVDNIFSQPCYYCGESDWTKLGCDRIDNSLPHTPDNVVPCCLSCNNKKHTKIYEDFCKEIGIMS